VGGGGVFGRGETAGAGFGYRERGEGTCEVGRGAAHRGEEAVELFAVEGAEFHVALDDAVEVDFLGFEVVEPVGWGLAIGRDCRVKVVCTVSRLLKVGHTTRERLRGRA
jgi:hypothetical protein